MTVPAFVLTPFRYQDNLTVRRLYSFLGCESDCVIVGSCWFPEVFASSLGRRSRNQRFSIPVETGTPPWRYLTLSIGRKSTKTSRARAYASLVRSSTGEQSPVEIGASAQHQAAQTRSQPEHAAPICGVFVAVALRPT